MTPDGSIVQDGTHELCVYKADNKKWKNCQQYLGLPSMKAAGANLGHQTALSSSMTTSSGQVQRSFREAVWISTLCCSTKMTQKSGLSCYMVLCLLIFFACLSHSTLPHTHSPPSPHPPTSLSFHFHLFSLPSPSPTTLLTSSLPHPHSYPLLPPLTFSLPSSSTPTLLTHPHPPHPLLPHSPHPLLHPTLLTLSSTLSLLTLSVELLSLLKWRSEPEKLTTTLNKLTLVPGNEIFKVRVHTSLFL